VLEKELKTQLNNKRLKIKVGHGGTLDPLATGVLVLGIGDGCKDLAAYLKGSKRLKFIYF
jgi:tRNA pseudouridine55 synthase